jgi:methionyl-tRNA formyltransferase
MKIAFCTCVQLGKSCIETVISSGGRFDLFLTLHDHLSKYKSGRIFLDEIAANSEVPLYKMKHINDPDVAEVLNEYSIDWLFIIGWSQIASIDLLNIPKKGVIGAHPTLLPVGRGRAAVPWAILKGLNKTGVTFFKMDVGVDTGNILDQVEILIDPFETATTLYQKINLAHSDLIKTIWPKLLLDRITLVKQNESLATYWEGRSPSDGELFVTMTLSEVDRIVRATTRPYPGAFLMIGLSKKLIIWNGSINSDNYLEIIQFSDGPYYIMDSEEIILD